MAKKRWILMTICAGLPVVALASQGTTPPVTPTKEAACDLAAASPWIRKWLGAWELTSREILKLPNAPAPKVTFYDSTCVYTTSDVSAPGAAAAHGPELLGAVLPWRAAKHDGTITLPDKSKVPVKLMSFASNDRETGPFFIMAAPDYWTQAGHGKEPGLTGVFLHEFSHTRQVQAIAHVIGPIDSAWKLKEELKSDVVQARFKNDSDYVAAYTTERDLLHRAATAEPLEDVRSLASQALSMIRSRRVRWFTGDNAVFATLDDFFLSMEGAGQWTAAAWLAHPKGGGLDRAAAVELMLGQRRVWAQDEGLAIFLIVDRLLREWPSLVYAKPSVGAVELLERAIYPERTANDPLAAVRRELEARYAENEAGFFARDPDRVMRLRHPEFHTITPDGTVSNRQQMDERTRRFIGRIERFEMLSETILELKLEGDTAHAVVDQRTVRKQRFPDGELHEVRTSVVQRESWVRTPEGWLLWRVDEVQPGKTWVDGVLQER